MPHLRCSFRPPLLILLLAVLLSGCLQPVPAASPSATPPGGSPGETQPAAVPTDLPAGPTPEPSATGLPAPTRPQITLDLDLDYAQHSVSVSQSIQTQNPAGKPLTEIVLLAEPLRQPGVLAISEILLDGQSLPIPTPVENRLTLPLPDPWQPGQALTLSIRYTLTLPAIPPPSDTSKPVPFGWTARQINLVDWYFFLPPYQADTGWLANRPGYFGEHLVYPAADFDVTLRRSGTLTDYPVAASAPAEAAEGALRYRLEGGRAFALSASPMYEVRETQAAGVTVISYAFPFHPSAGQRTLEDTAAALALYAEQYGPYPYRSLSVVEADFLDGMEYSGLYFLSRGFYDLYDGTPQGYLTIIAVHETAHQWWFSLVGNDQAQQPWLDEAFCTFSELLFFEHAYPELVGWWRAFRVDFYDPQGPIDRPIYGYNGFTPYRNAVYLRGALFLDALRQELGQPAFMALLRDYAQTYAFQIATQADFLALAREQAGPALDALLEEYFEGE